MRSHSRLTYDLVGPFTRTGRTGYSGRKGLSIGTLTWTPPTPWSWACTCAFDGKNQNLSVDGPCRFLMQKGMVMLRATGLTHVIETHPHIPIYLSIYLSIDPSIHLSMDPPLHKSIYPSMHLSIYLCIHLSMYPSLNLARTPHNPSRNGPSAAHVQQPEKGWCMLQPPIDGNGSSTQLEIQRRAVRAAASNLHGNGSMVMEKISTEG